MRCASSHAKRLPPPSPRSTRKSLPPMTVLNLTLASSANEVTDRVSTAFTAAPPFYYAVGAENSSNNNRVAHRFTNVTIPPLAVIVSAVLTVRCWSGTSGPSCFTKLLALAEDNPTIPTSSADWNARAVTTAQVDWDIATGWSSGVDYSTPNFATVIQEIVNRAGWASGNALVTVWKDDGSLTNANNARLAQTRAYTSSFAARLAIEYTDPPPPAAGGNVYGRRARLLRP